MRRLSVLLALVACGLSADTLTLASGSGFVTLGAGNGLAVTPDSAKALAFERLYAGNGYFHLRVS